MVHRDVLPVLPPRVGCRVAIVSTFPPAECGIGNYTQDLVAALADRSKDTEVVVLAEYAPGSIDSPAVRRVWNRRTRWVADLLAAVDIVRPDLVHVQHEESHQGQGREMLRFVRELRARGIAVVVTLHSVYAGLYGRRLHRRLADAGVVLIAHQRTAMAEVLEAQGVPGDQIATISLGTSTMTLPPQAVARAALGLPVDGTVVLFFGFIHPKKGLHIAVEAFERAAQGYAARLVIAGRVRNRWFGDSLYAAALRRRMRDGIANQRIIFRPGFVDPDDKAAYFAAADLLVMPYQQRYGSASAVLHDAFAARRAFICSRSNKFAEAVDVIASEIPEAFPASGDVDQWTHGLQRMLSSGLLRARMSELTSQLADSSSWSKSADRHANLYRATIARDVRPQTAVSI